MLLNSGCILAAAGVAVGVGSIIYISQDRSAGIIVDDYTIWGNIHRDLMASNHDFAGITVKVHDGRVLLTGHVDSPHMRLEATRIAWNVAGVKEVINEAQLRKDSSSSSYVNDVFIASQVRSELLLMRNVKSFDYAVDCVDSVVYIFGVAQSRTELDAVVNTAKTVKGVTKVVVHARIEGEK